MQKVIVILTHPDLGDCAQQVVRYGHTKSKIEYDWKMKYGKMFFKCKVRVEGEIEKELKPNGQKAVKIKNLYTGDVYTSLKEASEATNLNSHTVYKQLSRGYKYGYKYLIKYV